MTVLVGMRKCPTREYGSHPITSGCQVYTYLCPSIPITSEPLRGYLLKEFNVRDVNRRLP